ncbi:MAG: ribosome biogenesis GTPase Der [Nevskiales bacterium]
MSSGLPVIALVGRPNVGKSTLFNGLTRSRDALVADQPGLTRDRLYGYGRVGEMPFLVVDTGGFSGDKDSMAALIARQTDLAVAEADVILLILDAREGLTGNDRRIAERLRRSGKPVLVVANKSEGLDPAIAAAEFYTLGLGEPQAVSGAHGGGIAALVSTALSCTPARTEAAPALPEGVRIAIVGRPNVGKSTLVNRLLGEERVLAFDAPGTTRDSIAVPFTRDDKPYVLIDTAGIRRRARVTDHVEKISVIKALQTIEDAHVVIAVVDAQGDIGVHDAHLLGLIAERGRAMVIAVNKWDGLERSARTMVQREITRKLPFLDYAPLHCISALHGSGLGELFESVDAAQAAAVIEMPTPELTRVLEQAVEAHAPPAVVGRRIKLRYAHQGGRNPPKVIIHGNQTDKLPVSYHRYLVHRFRDAFKLVGAPLRLEFRTGENPFDARKNTPASRPPRRRRQPGKRRGTSRPG